jgi:hypothetical protein
MSRVKTRANAAAVVLLLGVVGVITLMSSRTGEAQAGLKGGSKGDSPLGPTRASDLITLSSSRALCQAGHPTILRFDQQNNGDGTTTPFTIPAGFVLVVTGIDFRQGITGSGPGAQEELFFYASSEASGSFSLLADLMAAPGSSDSRAGVSATITGVAIKSTAVPCWQVNSGSIGSASALLHGYVAPDL